MKINIFKKIIILAYFFSLSLGMSIPIFVYAQGASTPCAPGYTRVDGVCVFYQLLAPLPDPNNPTVPLSSFDPTKDTSLGEYLNLIIKLIIGISAALAVVMIVIGGIEYMTSELISSKEAGKERIREALLGLLIALGAYALLNTINPDLLKSSVTINQATIIVDLQADVPQTYDPITRKYKNGATFGNPWDNTVGTIAILPPYITVANSQCATIGQTNCTSTRGLNTSTLRTIQWGCRCDLVVTGGTESWLHGGTTGSTSHQLGSGTVDLRRNSALDTYLSGGKPLVRMQRYPAPGGPYLYEGNHWHIGP